MNIHKIGNSDSKIIIIFGGIGTPIIDIYNIIDININATYYIFEYDKQLFTKSFDEIIEMTNNKLKEISINSNNIFVGISIGGLIITNIFNNYKNIIKNIILLDTTNITSIPYLLSMNKKNNNLLNYNSIIKNIEITKDFIFDNLNIISHINMKKYNENSIKYKYYKNLSNKSKVIIHENISHDLHIFKNNDIKNNIYNLLYMN
jgi:hypothetical protein